MLLKIFHLLPAGLTFFTDTCYSLISHITLKGEWLSHLIRQMSWHTSINMIKIACSVCVMYLCFVVMAGHSGSSEVNKSMSFDKHVSHPHAHVLPGAVWFIRVNITGVWKPLMRPNPFTGLLTNTPHTETRINHPLFHTWKYPTCICCVSHWDQSLFLFPTESRLAPGYSLTCGTLLVFFFLSHTVFFSFSKSPHHCHYFSRDLIKTTFTRLQSSHDSLLPLCSLSNEVSELCMVACW